jgi:YkoY family integral membrane protein
MENLFGFISQNLSLNTCGILLTLVAIEAVLSADNAVALAALVEPISDPRKQRQALNLGLIGAFILRIILILTATWIVQFWQFEMAGALYLLWLSSKYLWQRISDSNLDLKREDISPFSSELPGQFIVLIALTDLAFSLDSVTTAVALSNRVWLVLTGGVIGVITLRFLAGLFIKWLAEFTYLQDAAYLTVFAVGIRLFFRALFPYYLPPEWLILTLIASLFTWGFSQRVLPETEILPLRSPKSEQLR